MQISNERRGQPRALLETTVIAFIGDERIECRAIDISANGIALLSPVVRSNGQFLRVNFALPQATGPRWLDADGVVARVARAEDGILLGVQFLVIEDRAAREVHAYVEQTRLAAAQARQQEVYVRRVAGSSSTPASATPTGTPPPRAHATGEVRMPDANNPPRVTGEFTPAGMQRRTDEYGRADETAAEAATSPVGTARTLEAPRAASSPTGQHTPTGTPPRGVTPTGTPQQRSGTPSGTPQQRSGTPTGTPQQRSGTPTGTPSAGQPPQRSASPTGSMPQQRSGTPTGTPSDGAGRWPGESPNERTSSHSSGGGTGRWPGEAAGGGATSSQSSGGGTGRFPGAAARARSGTDGAPRSDGTGGAPTGDTTGGGTPRRSTRPPEPATDASRRRATPTSSTERPAGHTPTGAAVSKTDLAALYRDALDEVEGKPKGKKRK